MSSAAAADAVSKAATLAKAYTVGKQVYKNLPNKKTIYNKVAGATKVIHKAGSTIKKNMLGRAQQLAMKHTSVHPAKQAGMVMRQSRPTIASRGNGKDKMLPSSLLRKTRG
jgi:hypothetical protein